MPNREIKGLNHQRARVLLFLMKNPDCTALDLQRGAQVCNDTGRVSELRKLGCQIENRYDGVTPAGSKLHRYNVGQVPAHILAQLARWIDLFQAAE